MGDWLGIQKVGWYLLARSLDEVVNGEIGNQVLCRKLNRPMGHKTLGLVNVQFTEDKKSLTISASIVIHDCCPIFMCSTVASIHVAWGMFHIKIPTKFVRVLNLKTGLCCSADPELSSSAVVLLLTKFRAKWLSRSRLSTDYSDYYSSFIRG